MYKWPDFGVRLGVVVHHLSHCFRFNPTQKMKMMNWGFSIQNLKPHKHMNLNFLQFGPLFLSNILGKLLVYFLFLIFFYIFVKLLLNYLSN